MRSRCGRAPNEVSGIRCVGILIASEILNRQGFREKHPSNASLIERVRRRDVISLMSVELRDRRSIDARVEYIKVTVCREANEDDAPNKVRL